jgi:hypothetical protein
MARVVRDRYITWGKGQVLHMWGGTGIAHVLMDRFGTCDEGQVYHIG